METETERGMGTQMTDADRQKLVKSLKAYQGYDRELNKLVHEAADEIERLATELDKARKRLALIKYDRDEQIKFGRRYD